MSLSFTRSAAWLPDQDQPPSETYRWSHGVPICLSLLVGLAAPRGLLKPLGELHCPSLGLAALGTHCPLLLLGGPAAFLPLQPLGDPQYFTFTITMMT